MVGPHIQKCRPTDYKCVIGGQQSLNLSANLLQKRIKLEIHRVKQMSILFCFVQDIIIGIGGRCLQTSSKYLSFCEPDLEANNCVQKGEIFIMNGMLFKLFVIFLLYGLVCNPFTKHCKFQSLILISLCTPQFLKHSQPTIQVLLFFF